MDEQNISQNINVSVDVPMREILAITRLPVPKTPEELTELEGWAQVIVEHLIHGYCNPEYFGEDWVEENYWSSVPVKADNENKI